MLRGLALVVGLFLFALGIVLQLQSELGLSPWDVLNQGISDLTGLSFGTANIVVAVVVLAVAWGLGARIGIGTVANAVLIGLFVVGAVHIREVSPDWPHPGAYIRHSVGAWPTMIEDRAEVERYEPRRVAAVAGPRLAARGGPGPAGARARPGRDAGPDARGRLDVPCGCPAGISPGGSPRVYSPGANGRRRAGHSACAVRREACTAWRASRLRTTDVDDAGGRTGHT